MSNTVVRAPLIAALVAAEEEVKKTDGAEGVIWKTVNEIQTRFLDAGFLSDRSDLSGYSETELRSWVSWVAAELNDILRKEGFSIHLDDFSPGKFGVVSILDVLVEWLAEGTSDTIPTQGGREYPGVYMEPSASIDGTPTSLFEVLTSEDHGYPVARVKTKSDDLVYMTVADGSYADFELVDRITTIKRSLTLTSQEYDGLKFPMVDLDQEESLAWLVGMVLSNPKNDWAISQALQQTKFKMNQYGARVKSAVAVGLECLSISLPKPILEIDKPFFLWIERPTVVTPVMYAYINEENWKDPGSLDDI